MGCGASRLKHASAEFPPPSFAELIAEGKVVPDEREGPYALRSFHTNVSCAIAASEEGALSPPPHAAGKTFSPSELTQNAGRRVLRESHRGSVWGSPHRRDFQAPVWSSDGPLTRLARKAVGVEPKRTVSRTHNFGGIGCQGNNSDILENV